MDEPGYEIQKIALRVAFEEFGPDSLWLVGGWVRDTLLGRPSADIDLASSGTPAQVISKTRDFANAARSRLTDWHVACFPLDRENGVARVHFSLPDKSSGFYFDLAALAGNNLETDLRRRDFTVNSLALPLESYLNNGLSETVIDLTGGLADLEARLIRPVSEANIISDPLRMLRGIRLRAQARTYLKTNWEFAPGTIELFQKHAPLILQSAGERTGMELNKIFLAGAVESHLRLMDKCGLLSHLIPELDEGKGCIQMQAHHYDVWNHTMVAVDCLERIVSPDYRGTRHDQMLQKALPAEVVRDWPKIVALLQTGAGERLLWLTWGTLLHDVGKPRTRTVNEKGLIHFYEHQKVGAEMTRQILQRFHFSRATIEGIATMVLQHLRLGMLSEKFDPASGGGVTKRALYRFIKDTEPVQVEMLPLSLADHSAVNGPGGLSPRHMRSWERHLHLTDKVAGMLLGGENEKIIGKPRLVDGKTLISELGLSPGPQIGKLLGEIEEAQAVGEISTSQEALSLARTLLSKKPV